MKHSLSKLQISHQSVSQVSGIAVILILIAFPLILNQYRLSILTEVLIFGLLAMSLDILIGYTGLVSFNHATFFGVAAYTVGIFFQKGFQNFWFTLPAGIIVSLLLAMLLGLLVLRSSGPYFLMITLAFGQLIFAVAWKWRSLTGGDDGLAGISRPEMGLPLSSEEGFYYLVLIFFLSSYFFLKYFFQSQPGKSIIGVRESESRMQALGYNTWLLKYLAYVISGGFAGLAGVLYIYYNGFISPQELNWSTSGLLILMVIIGGAGTLTGPVLGAGLILILQNFISAHTERWPLLMGMLFVICVSYARDGICGYLNKMWEKGYRYYESPRNTQGE